jgi:thiamine pyrophosphokinase
MTKTFYIFGAGDFDGMKKSPAPGDYVIAADGGYRHCIGAGIVPDLVLGDFDSLGAPPEHPNVMRVPAVKDDTDMMLAVKTALGMGAEEIIIYGGLGGKRLDHTLANIAALHYAHLHGAAAYLIGGGTTITVTNDIRFTADMRGYVSVFALGGEARGVEIRGLKYELTDAVLKPEFPLGVSNEFAGREARIWVKEGTIVVMTDNN